MGLEIHLATGLKMQMSRMRYRLEEGEGKRKLLVTGSHQPPATDHLKPLELYLCFFQFRFADAFGNSWFPLLPRSINIYIALQSY